MIINGVHINPIAFSIFGFDIYWYGVCYVLSLLLIYKYFYSFAEIFSFDTKYIDIGFSQSILFGLIFARIFDVIVYNFYEFSNNLLMIFQIRQGGLSFHGAVIGVCLHAIIFCKIYKLNFLKIFDFIGIFSPICIFFVRIANFINMELIGRPCESSWYSIEIEGSHFYPSQLIESFFEGFLLFLFMLYLLYVISCNKVECKTDVKLFQNTSFKSFVIYLLFCYPFSKKTLKFYDNNNMFLKRLFSIYNDVDISLYSFYFYRSQKYTTLCNLLYNILARALASCLKYLLILHFFIVIFIKITLKEIKIFINKILNSKKYNLSKKQASKSVNDTIDIKPGFFGCAFLYFYGVARFFCEFFRLPEVFFVVQNKIFTVGQCLSVLMIVLSFIIYSLILNKN